ncbi:DUF4262 domain-containing protein [Micromonospora aurantiaca (nom. illeg.)]|uniref:DUF4262 domain-containing protein n=1 Tax=Micromonospora aurantiaca (nom. illeg.) TaxID=47850 RepID=UPI00378B717A
MPNIDDVFRRQEQIIDTTGWAVMHVLPTDDDPDTTAPFAYTVGLTEHDVPELVIAGLDPHIAQALLNDLARRVHDRAERLTHGQRVTDLLAGYDAVIVEGPATEALHPGAAYARYGTDRVRLQQIVWPDKHGRFPWADGYEYPAHVQPLLGRP